MARLNLHKYLSSFIVLFTSRFVCGESDLQLSSCVLKLSNGSKINLNEVANHDLQHTPRFSGLHPLNKSDIATYSFNPCDSFIYPPDEGKFGPCGEDVAVCRSVAEGNLVIGTQESSLFVFNETAKHWSIIYKGKFGDKRVTLDLICTNHLEDELEVFGRSNGTHAEEYKMTLISRCACPDGCGYPILPRGMSWAALVFLVFICITFSYVLFGCVYRRVVVGARGVEALPHHSMWIQLPNKTKDAFYYIVRCGTSTDVTYERI